MSKLTDIINNQVNNDNSALQKFLNGKPVATAEMAMETNTILKLAGGILLCGAALMLFFKYFIQKK